MAVVSVGAPCGPFDEGVADLLNTDVRSILIQTGFMLTFQRCEEGQTCGKGYWSQSGTYGRGSDIDGWPQNTTVAVAEAACTASPTCVGYTYSSSELHPGATKLKIYLKNNGTGSVV